MGRQGSVAEEFNSSNNRQTTYWGGAKDGTHGKFAETKGALTILYRRTARIVGRTKERNTSSICEGVKRLRRFSHQIKTEKKAAVR